MTPATDAPPATPPVATYRERRFDGERRFTLFADRVEIVGKRTFSSEFEQSVPLAPLDAKPGTLRLRSPSCFAGVLAAAGGGFLLWFVDSAYPVVGMVIAPGVILALATARKVEFARFTSRATGAVVLDVAKAGPDRERFEEFVASLSARIAACNAAEPVLAPGS